MNEIRIALASGLVAWGTLASMAIVTAAQPLGAQAPSDKLPEAPGKAVLIRICTACHDTDVITEAPRTVPGWVDTVLSMKDFGATGTDEEFKAVTDYVIVNLAVLQVNKSSAAEIAQVLRVSEQVGEGVVAYRDKVGGFKTVEDLKKAPDVDAATIDALGSRLSFGS